MNSRNFALALTAALSVTLICGCVTTPTSTTPQRDINEKAEAR